MTRLLEQIKSLRSINPLNYRIMKVDDLAELAGTVARLRESLAAATSTGWLYTGSSDFNVGDSRSNKWRKIKEQSLAGWAADTAVKRVTDIFTEWCLAGNIRFTTAANAGWLASTMRKLFPYGLSNFFSDYIFHWAIFGELYFLPKLDLMRRLVSYELISPLEIEQVEHDKDKETIYISRVWYENIIEVDASSGTIMKRMEQRRQVYTNKDVVIIKWNSSADRGLPFVHQLVAWTLIYNEWLKDRAITNRMRSFAYLHRKIQGHAGTAKTKADQFSSQLMHSESYQPGRHDQYGYGFKKEKMPTGGILTSDQYTEWDTINFPIQGDDASPDGHAFRQQCCNLTGIPEALLFGGERAKLDVADSRVESFVRKVEVLRLVFEEHLNGILDHCRNVELGRTRRQVNTEIKLYFKPAAVGERRFFADDANKSIIGGHLSRRTAMEMSPFVTDPDDEERRIRAESKDELTQSFLNRLSKGGTASNRDDEDSDFKKKQKDSDAGTRGQEYTTKKKTGEET